jgi:hypothetical protein
MHYPALNHVTGHFTIFLLHCELRTSTDLLSSCCSAFRFLITPLHFTIVWMNGSNILPETTETICRILSGMVLQWIPRFQVNKLRSSINSSKLGLNETPIVLHISERKVKPPQFGELGNKFIS